MRPIHSPHCACRFHNIYRGMALGTVLTTQSWYVKCIWVLKIQLYWSDDIILNSRRDPAKFCKYLSKFHGIHDRLHGVCCFRLQWVSHTSTQLRLRHKKIQKGVCKMRAKEKERWKCNGTEYSTQWNRDIQICINKPRSYLLVQIPVCRCHAITWTNVDVFSTEPIRTALIAIWIRILNFPRRKCIWKLCIQNVHHFAIYVS